MALNTVNDLNDKNKKLSSIMEEWKSLSDEEKEELLKLLEEDKKSIEKSDSNISWENADFPEWFREQPLFSWYTFPYSN